VTSSEFASYFQCTADQGISDC